MGAATGAIKSGTAVDSYPSWRHYNYGFLPVTDEVDMRIKRTLVVFSQLLLIGWASVWITALPLFHTHLPGVFEQPIGIPHTVFSPDLPGEYSAFGHKIAPEEFQLSVLASNSPELGFVASPADKKKPRIEPVYAGSPLLLPPRPSASVRQELPLVDSNSRWLSHAHWYRGPPASISL